MREKCKQETFGSLLSILAQWAMYVNIKKEVLFGLIHGDTVYL